VAPGLAEPAGEAVIWNGDDTDANTAAGIRVSLNLGQTTSIDSPENKSPTLKCGDDAESLAMVDSNKRYASTKSGFLSREGSHNAAISRRRAPQADPGGLCFSIGLTNGSPLGRD
jgi:hypothetical protein